jgi:hypothetical protein
MLQRLLQQKRANPLLAMHFLQVGVALDMISVVFLLHCTI